MADVVMGLAATSLMLLDKEGMLMAYAPKGLETISGEYRDTVDPPKWVGMDVWVVGPVLQHRRGREGRSSQSRRAGKISPSRNTRARSPCPIPLRREPAI